MKHDPEMLAYEVYYTPYSRSVFENSFSESEGSSLEKAVRFCVRLNMGYGYRTTNEKVGWKNDVQGREKAYASFSWKTFPDRILEAAERLRGVQIENRPAIELMERFNFSNVLIYLDPPYMPETRCGKIYQYEMSSEDHTALLETARAHKGPLLISGYESELYDQMLTGWHKETRMVYNQVCSAKKECLWMNFDPGAHQIELAEYLATV